MHSQATDIIVAIENNQTDNQASTVQVPRSWLLFSRSGISNIKSKI